MRKRTLAIVVATLVVTVGAVAFGAVSLGALSAKSPAPAGTTESSGAAESTTPTEAAPAAEPTETASSAAGASAFEPYTPEAVASAADTDAVVLFFHATWCPTCKQLADDIRANIDQVPTDVRILLVDYDTATDLKQKYGVTLQHTLVQVDSAGNALGTWNGTPTLDELLSQLT